MRNRTQRGNPQYVKEVLDSKNEPFGPNGAENAAEDLSWFKIEDIEELPDKEPEIIIAGLLRIGEKLGITAGSKSFKSWMLLCTGYCISNGLDFIGFKTTQSKVLVIDLELSRWGLKRRLKRIQKELGKAELTNIKVCSLKGKSKFFCKNFDKVKDIIKAGEFKVVILDPVYKFLLGQDESSNGLVADMLDDLTMFCMESNVAMIYVHHHSKGNQAGKESLDRGSGAGAWSRDPDAVFDLSDHKDSTKEERIYSAEITVREFPPVEKFVVRWKYPLLVRDDQGLDPSELKEKVGGTGGKKGDSDERIITALRTAECIGGIEALKAGQLQQVTGVKHRTFYEAIKRLQPSRVVKSAMVKGGYQLSVSERQKAESDLNHDSE
jgi:AAA domain